MIRPLLRLEKIWSATPEMARTLLIPPRVQATAGLTSPPRHRSVGTAVADRLGHSSIAVTGDVYGHTSDHAARSAVDALGAALGPLVSAVFIGHARPHPKPPERVRIHAPPSPPGNGGCKGWRAMRAARGPRACRRTGRALLRSAFRFSDGPSVDAILRLVAYWRGCKRE
jgi:hypothetical protein